jgi:hypothetical protein
MHKTIWMTLSLHRTFSRNSSSLLRSSRTSYSCLQFKLLGIRYQEETKTSQRMVSLFMYLSSSRAFSMAGQHGEALVSKLTLHSAIPPIEHSSVATGPQKQAMPMHHYKHTYSALCAIKVHNLLSSPQNEHSVS